MKSKINLHYASLNCNSLVKSNSPTTQSSFIRYLRLQQFDILSLQETRASDSTIPSFNLQLQAIQTFWTYYCGIISFSPNHVLTLIDTDEIYTFDRFILCKVNHPHDFYEPYFILNLYIPANSNVERRKFFDSVCSMLLQLDSNDTISLSRLIISGDFNYDYGRDILCHNRLYKTSSDWIALLLDSFYNCMSFTDMEELPTFQRNVTTQSVIDYVYSGIDLQYLVTESTIEHIQPCWSDHALLAVKLTLGDFRLGPGLWRGNPAYAKNTTFRQLLEKKLLGVMDRMSPDLSPQLQWEAVKQSTKQVIKSFGIKHVSWRKLTLRKLEKKRNRLLRSKPPVAVLQQLLPKIDNMIHLLQQELVDVAALKAGVTWREKGERSAKYLKNIHKQRTTQQYMATLQPPSTSSTDLPTSDPEKMQSYAHQFYQNLYSVDPVDDDGVLAYLDTITFDKHLGSADAEQLTDKINISELIVQANRLTKNSSPGADGLSYAFLAVLFQLPCLEKLVHQIYNDALNGVFPPSWQDIRVRLLH
jgi:endonuclease/exonuclease/phosphatase family metal-dependent hydrolase